MMILLIVIIRPIAEQFEIFISFVAISYLPEQREQAKLIKIKTDKNEYRAV